MPPPHPHPSPPREVLDFLGCSFEDNVAAGGGGALHLEDYKHVHMLDTTFARNVARQGTGGAFTALLSTPIM